jgi:competence protein ComEA
MREWVGERTAGVVLCLAGLAAGGVFGLIGRQPVDPTPPRPFESVAHAAFEVHIVGWVASPGVVSVPPGSLVVDAVMAAGGLRPGASVEGVNLAAPLTAGQQIVVPGPTSAATGHAPPDGPGGKISLNRATQAELETLPGVGPVLAARIVAHRDMHGPFATVEDLLSVSGIGESKLASIRDLVSVP